MFFGYVNAEYTVPPDITTMNYVVVGGGGGGAPYSAAGPSPTLISEVIPTIPFLQIGMLVVIAGIIFMLMHYALSSFNRWDYDADPHFRKETYKNTASIDKEIDRIIARRYTQHNPNLIKKLTGSKEKEPGKEWVIKNYDR